MPISEHLKNIVDGPAEQRRKAVMALAAASDEKSYLLDRLAQIIDEQASFLYQKTPDGLKPSEPEKYAAMNLAAIAQQAAIQTVLMILGPDGLLDSDRFVGQIDRSGMLKRLGRWTEHQRCMRVEGEKAAKVFQNRHANPTIRQIKIFGLGGSGAPHDIAAEVITNWRKSSTPIEVVHADSPNADLVDENTLVLLCSFSGNTEETLHCYETVRSKRPLVVALAQGGMLREIAQRDELPFMQIPDDASHPAFVMQPRESVCLQMTATLAFLSRIGLTPGSGGPFRIEDLEFDRVASLLQTWRDAFAPEVPFHKNLAKQLAFFLLYGIDFQASKPLLSFDPWQKKVPFVLVDRNHRAIGHETRTQMHERSKLNAAFYEAPECLHNLVESIRASAESADAGLDPDAWVYYFLRSIDEEPRIRLRWDQTIERVFKGRAKYAILNIEGENPFERALYSTYFNAHMTTYLALLGGYDPLPVPTMSWIKNIMQAYPRDSDAEKTISTRPPLLFEGLLVRKE